MKYVCTICGYVHEGDEPPEKCPICNQPKEKFKPVEEEKPKVEPKSTENCDLSYDKQYARYD